MYLVSYSSFESKFNSFSNSFFESKFNSFLKIMQSLELKKVLMTAEGLFKLNAILLLFFFLVYFSIKIIEPLILLRLSTT